MLNSQRAASSARVVESADVVILRGDRERRLRPAHLRDSRPGRTAGNTNNFVLHAEHDHLGPRTVCLQVMFSVTGTCEPRAAANEFSDGTRSYGDGRIKIGTQSIFHAVFLTINQPSLYVGDECGSFSQLDSVRL